MIKENNIMSAPCPLSESTTIRRLQNYEAKPSLAVLGHTPSNALPPAASIWNRIFKSCCNAPSKKPPIITISPAPQAHHKRELTQFENQYITMIIKERKDRV